MTATMAPREWQSVDKSAWGAGPWQQEPDKVQWVDEATGLDCLLVRGPHGSWCGYVGVTESHPWFGVDYSGCPQQCSEDWCSHRPESRVEVHGGLTFSSFCHEPTRDAWERMRAALPEHRATAEKYPQGDSAEWVARFAPFEHDYDGWAEAQQGRSICHVPLPGRPARVWWFGFDCAHYGDLSPKYVADRYSSAFEGAYRCRAYVESEVRQLAAQLTAV